MQKCKKCQEYKSLDFFPNRKSSVTGKRNECKKCKSEINKIWKKENKDKVKANSERYYLKNKLEINKRSRASYNKDDPGQWRLKFPEKYNIYHNKYEKEFREEIGDEYVKRLLCDQGFNRDNLTKELIETKRIIIKTKRLCRTS